MTTETTETPETVAEKAVGMLMKASHAAEYADRDEARLHLASLLIAQSERGILAASVQVMTWASDGR